MSSKRLRPAAAHSAAGTDSIYGYLDEDALEAVLHAADAIDALGSLATADKLFCGLARSRMPLYLCVSNAEEASLLLQAAGKRPFSGCRQLWLSGSGFGECLLAASVINAVQQWPALEQLSLTLGADNEQQPGLCLDQCMAGALGGLSAVQSLRRLVLDVPQLGSCCARLLGQVQQLTSLDVCMVQPAGAAAEFAPLAAMTNLVELLLDNPPNVQPAAGAATCSLPSSLTSLAFKGWHGAANYAPWFGHLAGCPNLQRITFGYDGRQPQSSSYPRDLVQLLAQHNRQLRTLELSPGPCFDGPAALAPDRDWRPDASLAALSRLECLDGGGLLCIRDQGDWQHLAQLTALTRLRDVHVFCAPAGDCALAALKTLGAGTCHVGGPDMGRLLLACSQLQAAELVAQQAPHPPPLPAAAPLSTHPSLWTLQLDVRECEAAAAAEIWAGLAPVLGGMLELALGGWPCGSISYVGSSLPDLSACTALTRLVCDSWGSVVSPPAPAQQEDFLAMVAPLVQLQHVRVLNAPWINARAVLVLQSMLPLLEQVELVGCGRLLPHSQSQGGPEVPAEAEQQVLAKVKQLLRPGLVLSVR